MFRIVLGEKVWAQVTWAVMGFGLALGGGIRESVGSV